MNKKTLLITGASSDLGCDLLDRIGSQYDQVLAHYHHLNPRLELLKEKLGEKLILLHADFTDEGSTGLYLDHLRRCDLTIDHFVHFPAAAVEQRKFATIRWEQIEQEMRLSLRSFAETARTILPSMSKQKHGRIVAVLSSYTVGTPPKFLSDYVTVKYALLGMIKCLASEYSEKGVTVNAVSPEMVETKFLSKTPALIAEKNAMDSPLKRNLTVSDVTPMLVYLLSDDASAVSGQNFVINGGR